MNVDHYAPVAGPAEPDVAGPAQDPRRLRTVMGGLATGVTVVTVGGAVPHGMTANSFTSVSLVPPLVLICVNRDAIMHDAIVSVKSFAVSVLSAEQEEIARYFANRSRPRGMAQFESVEWLPGRCTGAPQIMGAVSWLECELRRAYDGGDHSIFLGRVISMGRWMDREALLFFDGQFYQLAGEDSP